MVVLTLQIDIMIVYSVDIVPRALRPSDKEA